MSDKCCVNFPEKDIFPELLKDTRPENFHNDMHHPPKIKITSKNNFTSRSNHEACLHLPKPCFQSKFKHNNIFSQWAFCFVFGLGYS